MISRRVACSRVVAFRTECGDILELNVSEDQYRDLKEGLVCGLTWKGSNLLSFTEKE